MTLRQLRLRISTVLPCRVLRWSRFACARRARSDPELETVTFLVPATGSPFYPTVTYPSGGYSANSLAARDLNGDGRVDLAVVNYCGNDSTCTSPLFSTVGVLLGNGDGSFQPAVSYNLGVAVGGLGTIAIADVNGDGKLDLLVTGSCSTGLCPTVAVGVLLGNGDGTFRPVVYYDAGGGSSIGGIAVADLNRDGKLDVVVGECGSDCWTAHGLVGVLLGNGDGTFQPASTYDSGAALGDSVSIGDLNGDGNPDVAIGNVVGNTVGILLGHGDGSLGSPVNYPTSKNDTYTVTLADLNHDGHLDLMVSTCAVMGTSCGGSTKGAVSVRLGNGDGTFQSAKVYRNSGTETLSIAVADINHDGNLDLVATNSYVTETLDIFLGTGAGDFSKRVTLSCAGECHAVTTADLNGDGRVDLVVANASACYTCDNSGFVGVILKK